MAMIMAALPAGGRFARPLRAGSGLPPFAVDLAQAEMEMRPPSAPPLRRADRGAKPFHQGTELGKAGVDGVGIVDRDGAVSAKPQRKKGHGDAVVEASSHGPAARHTNACAAPADGQNVPLDR